MKSTLKKFLKVSQKKKLFFYFGNGTFFKKNLFICQEGIFQARKIKKIHPEKISYIFSKKFLHFGKQNFLTQLLKTFYVSSKKFFVYFGKRNLLALKISYIFSKKVFLKFQEGTCKVWKSLKLTYFLSLQIKLPVFSRRTP